MWLIYILLAGALGVALAANGLTTDTWGFWIITLITGAMVFVSSKS